MIVLSNVATTQRLLSATSVLKEREWERGLQPHRFARGPSKRLVSILIENSRENFDPALRII